MKTTISKLTTVSLLLTGFFTSCNKSDDMIAWKTELLTQGEWKFEGYGLDENNNGIIEPEENSMQPCEKDDVYKFYADCTGVFSGGTTPCSEGEASVINFDWRFIDHGTQLAVFAAPEMISKLDENILEVYYLDQNLQGEVVRYIRRFHH